MLLISQARAVDVGRSLIMVANRANRYSTTAASPKTGLALGEWGLCAGAGGIRDKLVLV